MVLQSQVAYLKSRGVIPKVAMTAIVVITSVWVWDECLKYRFYPKRWGVVEQEAIYRSGQLSPSVILQTLKKYDIHRVIDLTNGTPEDGIEQTAELKTIQKLNIESIKIPLCGDGTGSLANYARAVAEVHKSVKLGQPVLVHCAAGSKRTSGVLVYYLVLVKHCDPIKTVREMQRYDFGPKSSPELIRFLNRNMNEVAKRLVKAGVLDHVPEVLPLLPCL